ncbi:MAG TPA: hypothetical protein VM487_23540 [Phycisphaerae bacterium]|nr:hypothetical protein [Phycisphaerae bacterium]
MPSSSVNSGEAATGVSLFIRAIWTLSVWLCPFRKISNVVFEPGAVAAIRFRRSFMSRTGVPSIFVTMSPALSPACSAGALQLL